MRKITCRWTFLLFLKGFINILISLFTKPVNSTIGERSKYLLEELPITCHHLLKLLIFSIKLAASLSVRVSFRCNQPRYRPVTLIFQLPTMSNCNADRCSFTLFTVKVAFQLSVFLLTTFDIQTFEWGNVFSIKLLGDNMLPKTILDVLFGVSLVPICKMTLSRAFLTKV